MPHTLVFESWTDANSKPASRFSTLYSSFIGYSDSPNRAKSIEETRIAIEVLEAFDAITEESTTVENGVEKAARKLKKDGGSLVLSPSAYRILRTSVDATVAASPFALARAMMEVKVFVDSAEKSE